MAPQDSFIDEDDDTCPLCVEEFDLSDKNFRPCPCGYQVCQFCFNNIKNNMNGLCPACRRPYDEKTIEWKVVTPEEIAQFKANIQKNAKKKAEQRQKEAQKREVESLNRKHLSGLRVVQKNLVYVVGLSPGIREEEILQTLRGEKYFGQYGKIIKIVVSKSKQGDAVQNAQGLGVYVTFARKEDAARCIAAVNGSQNGDRILRAQLGTTKYCSAYLRNEVCTNKSCMFLHEPGDNDDSYSRQDLSSINSVNTQRPLPAMASSSGSSSRQATQAQAPLQQAQPVTAATQPMTWDTAKDGSDNGDGSALPSSASWANRGVQQRSRRGSHATSGAASSPAVSQAMPVTEEAIEAPLQVQEPEPELEVEREDASPIAVPEALTSAEPPRPQRDPILTTLLKNIHSPALSFSRSPDGLPQSPTFPPLFDDYGGEKRRAMREHQQEETRLHIEQESQADLRLVSEPVEEDEPESGSLQLGGEPEDRDSGREVPQGFQRRPSTQLPIQRTNNGPVGPGIGSFQRNLNNLSSINGRAMTPQQQQLLSQQSSFAEQFSPGIGSQIGQGSTLFQQQGHNRSSSRYNFANEGSSTASSIKPSANPKLMAQQSSMMPSTQQGNQFYGSSMQGPPPGLKSTVTPPIGGMFGQNHGFGSALGGSAFSAGKENNTDMLRDMLRGRGSVGGQSHDAAKREFMFPSFLQQYPSASSTPAPASGPLASLYGQQTGAFHDFGQKQKKKGKKHRHANTSSSGGGGLVDLADPSILQARMQHQQQSNAGVGQGLFSGQAQDDQILPSYDVDALVADSTEDYGTLPSDNYDNGSRSSTPSIPPGFGLPHAHPPPAAREEVAPKVASKIIPTSAPFTPSRGIPFAPRAATPLTNVSLPDATTTKTGGAIESSTSQAKDTVKALAMNTGLSKMIQSQSSQYPLQSEDFPALDAGKGKAPVPSTPNKTVTVPKSAVPAVTKKTVTTSSSSTSITQNVIKSEKRGPPGLLNISVPTKPAVKSATTPDTPAKPPVAPLAFPPLPPSTPSTSSLQSPLTKNTPKTLRLVPTPKTETPIAGIATPSSATSNFPSAFPQSRQPSLASVSRQERPGTPTSEAFSDNASITSASISRANSPPPSRIGSAPLRSKTKSSQKKQRREAQREKERTEIESVAVKPEPEVEIAPIMGRKKKQKKERNFSSATGGSTPAASRPTSPGPADIQEDSKEQSIPEPVKEPIQRQAEVTEKKVPVEIELTKPKAKTQTTVDKTKSRATVPAPLPVEVEEEDLTPEPVDKPITIPTPASVLAHLIQSGELPDPNNLAILKIPLSGANARPQLSTIEGGNAALQKSALQKLSITPEDRATLQAGKPVHKNEGGAYRTMLTPNGDYVRNLTDEEERRYLQLQNRLAKESGPTTFVSTKHHTNNGFTLIGGRAVPNGPPSFFPPPNGNSPPLDPVSKIQRDEALSYINQYVLPSLSTNSQLEKALNANAIDAEMLRSSDSSSFPSWANDAAVGHSGPHNVDNGFKSPSQEGILATGLEGMTAHFAVGREGDSGRPLGNVSLLSLSDAESAMQIARKEAESIEKKLHALMKKNKRLLLGSSHH